MHKPGILLLNDFASGGGAEVVFNKTIALLKENYDVHVYTAMNNIGDKRAGPLSYIFSIKHKNRIISIIKQNSIRLIHVHNFRWLSPSVFYAVKKLRRLPEFEDLKLIVTTHDFSLIYPNSNFGFYKNGMLTMLDTEKPKPSYLFKRLDNNGILHSLLKKIQWTVAFKLLQLQKQINTVISPSNFLKKAIQLNYPYLKYKVVYNPYDAAGIAAASKIVKQPIKLVFIGRLAPEKGLLVLCDMLGKLKNKLLFTFDIYGDGPELSFIKQTIEENNLKGIVNLKGFLHAKQIHETLSNYDALIMSSLCYENAPLSIIEAAFANLQIIVPAIGGMKEMAELTGNYFFYEQYNVESLKETINNCMHQQFNNSYLPHLKSLFSSENYKKELISIYRNYN